MPRLTFLLEHDGKYFDADVRFADPALALGAAVRLMSPKSDSVFNEVL
jgi:hypothetical protein